MNYRHSFHAGNYADVVKHVLFVRLMRDLQRKEKGFLCLDTHAGRGAYDLSKAREGDTRERVPEWPAGIGRLWNIPPGEASVDEYLALVRAFDRSRGNLAEEPRFYPGSPALARLVLRVQDRLALWELHPAEFEALKGEFRSSPRVSVHQGDGYGAPRASLPALEKRALVLLDPPFESADEWSRMGKALLEGLARMPAATFALWYPLTDRARIDALTGQLRSQTAPSLTAELVVDPQSSRMRGCGVAVVNPPWKFHDEAVSALGYLSSALGADPGNSSVRWIVAE